MQIVLENDKIFNTIRDINKELVFEKDLDSIKEQFNKFVVSTFDKMVKYTIKSMPIPDAFKDVLLDVKDAFKTKDFKSILKTAIHSSIREGLEILGLDKESLKNFKIMCNAAIKGGLPEGIKAGIDIVAKKYLKNNIVGDYIYDFFNQVKNIPFSKAFTEKLAKEASKLDSAKADFLDKCTSFKEAYSEFNLEKMDELSKEINEKIKNVKKDNECIREANNIHNICKLVSVRKEKLTNEQLKLCNIM